MNQLYAMHSPMFDGTDVAQVESRPASSAGLGSKDYFPPLKDTPKAREALDALEEAVADKGWPLHRALLDWQHETQAVAGERELAELLEDAAVAREATNRLIRADNTRLDEKLAALEALISSNTPAVDAAADDYARLAARTGVVVPAAAFPQEVSKVPPEEYFAGQHGVYFETLRRRFSLLLAAAPLFIGPVTGTCIATLAGLVTYADVQKLNTMWPKLVFPALLGACVVRLVGEVAQHFGRSTANFEAAKQTTDSPGRTSWGGLAILGLTTLGLAVAEVLAEAMGLRELHQQHSMFQALLTGHALPEIPLAVAIAVSCIFSAPYLAFKYAMARETAAQQITAQWLKYQQHQYQEARLQEEDVRGALETSQKLTRLQARQHELEARKAALEAQRKSPLVGFPPNYEQRIRALRQDVERITRELHRRLENLTNAVEPLPRKPSPWAKLLRRFRRNN